MAAPDERTPEEPVPVAAPTRPDRTRFWRELTPAWLATTALLAGERPPELDRPLRYVHLGCGRGETAAVVAAAHPTAEVWAWDWKPQHVDATRRLRDGAGLRNLEVHERPGLPEDLGGGPADVVVVQEVLATAGEELHLAVADAIRASLRPGGIVCVTYPTLAGWSEVAPVQALLREVARRHRGDPEVAVPEALELLAKLRAGGARYLTERPAVAAWIDHLATLAPADLAATYLADALLPLSPARVAGLLAPIGCTLLGSARLTDELGVGLSPELAADLAAARDPIVRETYRDLATRRHHRIDVYRLGAEALPAGERRALLAQLRLGGLVPEDERPAAPLDREVWGRLQREGVAAGELHADPVEAARAVRLLLDAGQAHPMVADDVSPTTVSACDALTAALGAARQDDDKEHLHVVPRLGTALALSAGQEVPWAGGDR